MRWYRKIPTLPVRHAAVGAVLLLVLAVTMPVQGAGVSVSKAAADLFRANDQAPEAGRFLIASKDIRDPRFRESVVLILEHGTSGTVGLIINKPTQLLLSEVFSGLEEGRSAATLFFGGPVRPVVFSMLVRTEARRENQSYLVGNVYSVFGARHIGEAIEELSNADIVRVYSGYAGWSPGQLASEIERGGWHVARADPSSIFSMAPDTLWEQLIGQFSGRWI